MWRAMLACALALAMVGSFVPAASAESEGGARHAGFVVTEDEIAHFKAVLNLKPEQERYWAPIEATLRAIARGQNGTGATLNAGALRRLISSAMPLFRRLDAEQKREAMALARSLGIASIASAF